MLVKVELEVPKEMNDVKVFLIQLVQDIKEKKDIAVIISSSLPALISAVDGYEKLGEEAKLAEAYNMYALLVADLAKVLLAKPVEVAPVA